VGRDTSLQIQLLREDGIGHRRGTNRYRKRPTTTLRHQGDHHPHRLSNCANHYHEPLKGQPPCSHIEKVISTHLHRRHEAGHMMSISWVKGHIGVTSNEAVDKLVGETSSKGKGSLVITQEGIRAMSGRELEKHRSREGFGKDRYKWGNQALAAYTWCRTDKGPQCSWLHKIGKIPNPDCPKCGEEETGEYIVFECPGHR